MPMYKYQPETLAEIGKLSGGAFRGRAIAQESASLGLNNHEPLLVAMDSMLRYAKAYRARFEQSVAEDAVLGPPFLEIIQGIHALLDGDGAVAMELELTTDSKDNGMIVNLYWLTLTVGGYPG